MSQQAGQNELQNSGSPLILATKLHRPFLSPGLQPRANLMTQLEANVHCPLTLISAPAGYGKSTLASMWLEASDAPSAWLSLDEHDNDLRTFVTYVVAADAAGDVVAGAEVAAADADGDVAAAGEVTDATNVH